MLLPGFSSPRYAALEVAFTVLQPQYARLADRPAVVKRTFVMGVAKANEYRQDSFLWEIGLIVVRLLALFSS
jgi:hypothetical protein